MLSKSQRSIASRSLPRIATRDAVSSSRGPAVRLGLPHSVNTASSIRPSAPAPSRVRGFASAPEAVNTASLSSPLVSPVSRKPHFDKILIANRGEIACRVIRTARKLGIKTVAVYSEVDANSLHVQLADEAYCIGPAASSESYLRIDKIIEVCHRSGAQAVHPGYGFLSENADFAEQLASAGVVFIGPPASAIVSYPVLIKATHGGGGRGMRAVDSPAQFVDALASAQREARGAFGREEVLVERYIKRPRHVEVQVFADRDGGCVSLWERDCSVQRRNQKIIEEAPAPGLSPELRSELSKKAVAAARAVGYVGAGTVEFILDRDTNEFFFMEMNTRLQVEHPVTEMITGVDLVQWQLEVATGNPLPLSQSQIPLVGHAFEARIYAENPRNGFMPDSGRLLYLSTPAPTCTFAPSVPTRDDQNGGSSDPTLFTPPEHISTAITPSVRLEQGFLQGAQIGVFYDPMIAKLIAHGRDRVEALRMLRRALDEYRVVGVQTNVEFLRDLAEHAAFVDGDVETGFIQKHHAKLFPRPEEPTPEILVQAALFVVLREHPQVRSAASSSPWTSLASRRFGGDAYERTVTLQHTVEGSADDVQDRPSITVSVKSLPGAPGRFDVSVRTENGEKTFAGVSAEILDGTMLSTTLGGAVLRTTIVSQRAMAASSQMGEKLHVFHGSRRIALLVPPPQWLASLSASTMGAAKGTLKAPMPSVVVEVKVKVGDQVKQGDAIVVLESMKTETVLRAAADGVVRAVGCAKGDMVEEGKELAMITDVLEAESA
ncbi:uncharacterized protein FIBRA_02073 [Fibroporia radiculosa]|uniref:Uncharacterized protein n=1 Tax=Fibroporia radiculosa TaxID=599839 RepID=J4HUB9_9APHY|nr:uncharacterized protein FIBRA_02073 [Fibroporia radiculosa]CCM00047.1 predicted protein [Fibroporia radiculosa]